MRPARSPRPTARACCCTSAPAWSSRRATTRWLRRPASGSCASTPTSACPSRWPARSTPSPGGATSTSSTFHSATGCAGAGWSGGDWHVRFFRRGAVEWSDRVHTSPQISGRHARLPFDGANGILHFNYDDLQHFVDKTNRYTGKEAEDSEARSWEEVVRDARREVLERWAPGVDGTQSVALSMGMLFYRFLAGAKQWERHGFPEVGAPQSG